MAEELNFEAAYSKAVETGWDSVKDLARQIWDEARAKASQGGEAVAELSSDEILMAFEENGFRIEPGASFSAKGQIAQLLNAVGAILSAHPADQVAEPVLERPAKVGAGIFSAGLPLRMVVEAAYRQYEYAQDPTFSDENIKSLVQAFTLGNPQFVRPDHFREPAQMVDAELVELLRGLVEIVGRKNRGRSGSPNHSHSIPGIWDSDNGDLAGKPCAECALYDLAVARIAALQP